MRRIAGEFSGSKTMRASDSMGSSSGTASSAVMAFSCTLALPPFCVMKASRPGIDSGDFQKRSSSRATSSTNCLRWGSELETTSARPGAGFFEITFSAACCTRSSLWRSTSRSSCSNSGSCRSLSTKQALRTTYQRSSFSRWRATSVAPGPVCPIRRMSAMRFEAFFSSSSR